MKRKAKGVAVKRPSPIQRQQTTQSSQSQELTPSPTPPPPPPSSSSSSTITTSPPQLPPTLNLSQIKSICENPNNNENSIKICNTWGYLVSETKRADQKYWTLGDEYLQGGFQKGIKLCSQFNDDDCILKPLPGDIVRIHRLRFDTLSKCGYVTDIKNVVIWKSFVSRPIKIHASKKPTIKDSDEDDRRKLEKVYFNFRTYLKNLESEPDIKGFYKIAGRVEDKETGPYDTLILQVNDGTAKCKLRLFRKETEFENNVHYELALKLNIGQYIIASSAKRNKNDNNQLDLSANLDWGRSLRLVEPESISGIELAKSLKNQPLNNNNIHLNNENSQNDSNGFQGVRRSPRLNIIDPPSQYLSNNKEPFPKYTRISNIKKRAQDKYDFYDIAGQVRGEPKESGAYKNYFLRVFDGSKHDISSCYEEEFDKQIDDCIVIIVWSPQFEKDSNVHIETVKTLKDGDLILIKNLKAKWTQDGKAKFELNPNTVHNKGITLIDKESDFGIFLKEKLLPLDEPELNDSQLQLN